MTTEAKKAGNARHVAKLDVIKIQPYKEEGAAIRAAASASGMSVQAYILQAVRAWMEQESSPEDPQKPIQSRRSLDDPGDPEHVQEDAQMLTRLQSTTKPVYGSPEWIAQTGARLAAERQLSSVIQDDTPEPGLQRQRRLPPGWEEAITGRRSPVDTQAGMETHEQLRSPQNDSERPLEGIRISPTDAEGQTLASEPEETESAPTDLAEWCAWSHRRSGESVDDWRKRVKAALPTDAVGIAKHLGTLQEDERNLFLGSDPESLERNRQRDQERLKRFDELKALRDKRDKLSDREEYEYRVLYSELRYLIEQRDGAPAPETRKFMEDDLPF